MSGRAGRPGQAAAPPHLAPPSVRYRISYLAAVVEYRAEGRSGEIPVGRLADRDEFTRFVAAIRAGVERPGEPAFYLATLRGLPAPTPQPDGFVPQTTLWWVAGDEYLGRVNIRHYLTPHLLREGGNIGYEVRPSARRRGHATAMLAAALPRAAALGIDPARIDCDVTNVASRRVIEKNGGVFEEERDGSLYFWVPTT